MKITIFKPYLYIHAYDMSVLFNVYEKVDKSALIFKKYFHPEKPKMYCRLVQFFFNFALLCSVCLLLLVYLKMLSFKQITK